MVVVLFEGKSCVMLMLWGIAIAHIVHILKLWLLLHRASHDGHSDVWWSKLMSLH